MSKDIEKKTPSVKSQMKAKLKFKVSFPNYIYSMTQKPWQILSVKDITLMSVLTLEIERETKRSDHTSAQQKKNY